MMQTKKQKNDKEEKGDPSKKEGMDKFRSKSKRLPIDSLYKTIKSRRSTELRRKNNFSLGVNKFPLVARSNRQKFIQESFNIEFDRKNKFRKQNSSFTHFEKQDIQPWETL